MSSDATTTTGAGSRISPAPPASPASPDGQSKMKRLRPKRRTASLFAHGEPMVWLTGGALAICVLMIGGLLLLIVINGLITFWPTPVVKLKLKDGTVVMGEVTRSQTYEPGKEVFDVLPEAYAEEARAEVAAADGQSHRRLVRIGNYEISGNHFQWVDDFQVVEESQPKWAMLIERMENGRAYGDLEQFQRSTPLGNHSDLTDLRDEPGKTLEIVVKTDSGEQVKSLADVQPADELVVARETWSDPEAVWQQYQKWHDLSRERRAKRVRLEKNEIGAINHHEEKARLDMVQAGLSYGKSSPEYAAAEREYQQIRKEGKVESDKINAEIDNLKAENARYQLVLSTTSGQDLNLELGEIVRAVPSNQLETPGKLGVYLSRGWEFLTSDPREANSEGGVFPAIFGTVLMTMIMSLFVVPFGVLAALYLREYAKAGPVVSVIRIAINNLAGVPSIVFGVFGLAFFCYRVGKFVDSGPTDAWPTPLWFIVLAATVALGVAAFFGGVYGFARPRPGMEISRLRKICAYSSIALWMASVALVVMLIVKSPFFHGAFAARASEGSPTFGTGGMFWASLTLALLTAPVVIVATEEALSAVPNSMREGSYACGASKWQTIRRIVLPRAMPGIMTGMILAMARGAGEVAPLMLVGAVKLAPELPLEGAFPFGLDRSFMHLGFHIYDVGFQSQNSEAAKPMVFTTALLLIAIVALLNVAAIWIRARLKRKFVGNQF